MGAWWWGETHPHFVTELLVLEQPLLNVGCLCHGWSAGVVAYLMETVVGVKPQGTGMCEIKIEPQLSGLKQVKATYPTPYGVLKIAHELQADGGVKTTVDAPDGVKIVR